MNEIPEEIRASLKRLEPTKGYSWFWDDQWALLLSELDERETADEAGYVAIVPEEQYRWRVRFVIGEEWGHGFDPRNLIFEGLSEAKRYVDMVIGLDSGEIPILGDCDPR
jgi:hypothetical protein